MKKLLIILSFILLALIGYSQVTDVGEVRIANATTAFGRNLPVGTKVYNIATGDYWVATAGVVNTATLTTASESFTLLNDAGTDDQTASEVDITDAEEYYTSENVEGALQEVGADISTLEGSSHDAATVTDGTTIDLSITGQDITAETIDGAINHDALLNFEQDEHFTQAEISIDADQVGIDDAGSIIDATDVEGALQENRTAIDLNTAKETNVSTSLEEGTVTGTTYGITSDGSADDIVLPASTTTDAGLMTADQFDKLDAIESDAEANYTLITESFEEASGTPTDHNLSQTTITANGCRVSLNGATLDPDDYTLTSSTITVDGPVLQYDKIVITYSY
jgi:hypothetical protein